MLYRIGLLSVGLFILILLPIGCSTVPDPPFEPTIHIPSQSDWVDYGTILEAGKEGDWDYYLWGGFAFTALKKDDTYYLYYQGSSDYRTESDPTVLWRSIGVATSKDGIHFTKYEGNPILTWFPNQYGEEGAVSSGIAEGTNGELFLYYGANSQAGRTAVNADIRVATSLDGLTFTDIGKVLDHTDRSIWGGGDELFSVDAIHAQGQWIVYYIPNGTREGGNLGIAYGNEYDDLHRSSSATSNGNAIPVWGTAGHVRLDEHTYALTLNNVREKYTEVRLMSPQSPATLSDPVAVYRFDDIQQSILSLDQEKGIWFMYYRTFENSYGVKLAPVNNAVLPTPSTP